jgi:predicted enzyme related to lactoylglutathione lyase
MSVFRPAGISYLEVPAARPGEAAACYAAVFGWQVDDRGHVATFTDGTGHVIGHFVSSRTAAGPVAGILPHVHVESVDAVLARAVAHGATIVRAPYPEGDLRVAVFLDPSGNEIGVWQRAPA